MVRVRFAPSPTGALHIGGARTALFNYVYARQRGGSFILRIDDTDRERSRKDYENDIFAALQWLGIEWDEGPDCGGESGPYRQSEKSDLYRQYAEQLVSVNAAQREPDGAVRMRYPAGTLVVQDIVCGQCTFDTMSLGPEPVLLRSDGSPTYHLASVVDDISMRITHVIRGQDHLTNTAKHIALFEALGEAVPAFAHLPLILGEDGSKLSKRRAEDLISLTDFRRGGYTPEAIVNFLMLLGWSHPEAKEQFDLEEATRTFSLERVGHAAAVFEKRKLDFLNGWWIRHMPLEELCAEAKEFLGEYRDSFTHMTASRFETLLETFRPELHSLREMEWLGTLLFSLQVSVQPEAKEYFREPERNAVLRNVRARWGELLSEFAPEGDCYSPEQTAQMLTLLRKCSDEKKLVLQAFRVLLSGELRGPDLKSLLPFIRREVLQSRLRDVESFLDD